MPRKELKYRGLLITYLECCQSLCRYGSLCLQGVIHFETLPELSHRQKDVWLQRHMLVSTRDSQVLPGGEQKIHKTKNHFVNFNL